MTGKKTSSLPAEHAGSLLFITALLAALLFKGTNIEYYAVAQILLMLWLGWVALQNYQSGLTLPKTPLALCLTLFWLWLAMSISWSLAPNISMINFCWVGSVALVFWIYTWSPDRAVLWSRVAPIVLAIAVVLAVMGIYQVTVLEQQARSVFVTRNTHAALLNLVALPASAYFLLAVADKSAPRRYPVILGTALFILFLSIFLTTSRGGILSLLIAMGLLAALAAMRVPARALLLLAGLVVAAFLVTNIPSDGAVGVGERLPGLMQDAPRRQIWESSWNLLQDTPWHGIGLGLYYLAYPAYRSPADSTDGYFVHNDYLQFWIETGLPGLVLLLAVLLSALWLFVRALRRSKRRGDHDIEMTGLFCGLLAVAGHSMVDFNFYIFSIVMMAGLVLARFHELAAGNLKKPPLRLRPQRFIGQQVYPVIVVLLVLVPVFYFLALGIGNSFFDKGLEQAREGRLQTASASFDTARRLTPSDDRILIAHADLYRHAISVLPPEEYDGMKALYEDAHVFLDQAQQANALRGLTYLVRARLYHQNPQFAGSDGDVLALQAFRRGLELNPRLFQGRMDYVSLLLKAGKKDEAIQSLEEGARYFYPPVPELVPFYVLTAKFRREAGREQEARDLEEQARQLEKLATTGYQLRHY